MRAPWDGRTLPPGRRRGPSTCPSMADAERAAHDTVARMGSAIEVSGLVKTFGPTTALDGLDLEVRTGEVHGFLGPNGAGKTVTIRILLGLLRPDRGSVTLLGGDPWHDAVQLHR